MHGVHNKVGGAIHNAAQTADMVQLLAAGQIDQPRNTAAHRRGAKQGLSAYISQCGQLPVIGGDQRLVGGDHMLAGLQRSGNIFIGRVQASHDLRHHIDVGVM